MSETLTGTCLCDGVEYEVANPQALGYCHCTRCQHWTGSSLAGVVVAKDQPELAQAVADALTAMKADGSYAEVLEVWGTEGGAVDTFEVEQ